MGDDQLVVALLGEVILKWTIPLQYSIQKKNLH